MAPKPRTLARLAGLAPGTRPFPGADDWSDKPFALMGPAPFLDPFARARRAGSDEVIA